MNEVNVIMGTCCVVSVHHSMVAGVPSQNIHDVNDLLFIFLFIIIL